MVICLLIPLPSHQTRVEGVSEVVVECPLFRNWGSARSAVVLDLSFLPATTSITDLFSA